MADFTYVSTWQGLTYVAFIIDVFAGVIVGWRVSSSMETTFVLDALEWARRPSGTIHHSDKGSQYVSLAYTVSRGGVYPFGWYRQGVWQTGVLCREPGILSVSGILKEEKFRECAVAQSWWGVHQHDATHPKTAFRFFRTLPVISAQPSPHLAYTSPVARFPALFKRTFFTPARVRHLILSTALIPGAGAGMSAPVHSSPNKD